MRKFILFLMAAFLLSGCAHKNRIKNDPYLLDELTATARQGGVATYKFMPEPFSKFSVRQVGILENDIETCWETALELMKHPEKMKIGNPYWESCEILEDTDEFIVQRHNFNLLNFLPFDVVFKIDFDRNNYSLNGKKIRGEFLSNNSTIKIQFKPIDDISTLSIVDCNYNLKFPFNSVNPGLYILGLSDFSLEYVYQNMRIALLERKVEQPTEQKRPDTTNFETAEKKQNKKTGYVVGRVFLKLDGFQNINKDIIEKAEVEIAFVKDNKVTIINTTTDNQGYFVIENQPMDGRYYPKKIKVSVINVPVQSIVPDPNPTTGISGRIYSVFSSSRESFPPIIDCGETVIILKKKGKLAVERRLNKKKGVLDITKEKQYENLDGNFGYPGLEHYAQSGYGRLRQTASEALQDKKAQARAESMLEAIPENTKVDALIAKWAEVLQVYSGMGEVYNKLSFLLKLQKKYAQAIDIFQKNLLAKPNDLWTRVYLIRSYLNAGDVSNAVRIAQEGNKSFVYYQAYQSLWGNYQFAQAEQMLGKAVATYSDGTLYDTPYKTLSEKVERFSVEKKSQVLFVSYLKSIQEGNDYGNWKAKPYDKFIERHPLAKNINLVVE